MSQRSPTDLECTVYAEAFVTNGGDKTKAFKSTFPKSKAKAETLNIRAVEFHKLSKVCVRVSQLHKDINDNADKKALFTADEALAEYEEARQMAKELQQPAAMSSATNGKVKVAGLEKSTLEIEGSLTVKKGLSDFYQDSSE